MNRRRYLLRRLGWSGFVIWLVLTATFAIFAAAPDYNMARLVWAVSQEDPERAHQILVAYREQMHYDEPLLSRYLHWMKVYLTMDWGTSYVREAPVKAIVGRAAPVTLGYVVPSVLLSFVVGAAAGLYSSVERRGVLARLTNSAVYAGLALPAFWVGALALYYASADLGFDLSWSSQAGLLSPGNLAALVLPTLVLSMNLTAVQARYTRAETAEYVVSDFVKTVRASGGGAVDVARHVFRNALIPLSSLFFTRTLTVLLLSIYVLEAVFGLPGLGTLTVESVRDRDVAVIFAITFITVFFGVFGNLLQDVAYAVLDPRLEEG